MFLLNRLTNINRYQRVWLVFTALWILVANVIYYKNLYFYWCPSYGDKDYPIFYDLWIPYTFRNFALSPYSLIEHINIAQEICFTLTYSLIGHMYFVLMPCALIGLAYFAIEWVKKGEVRKP
jgi:hypothetical protein